MKILVVEDDLTTGQFVEKGLIEAGHTVLLVTNGEDGLHHAISESFDVIVLDRMLPKVNGMKILERVKCERPSSSVIILSAMSQIDDRVEGLREGADDYLSKPFAFKELLARIESLGKRRNFFDDRAVYESGDISLNRLTHEVKKGGVVVEFQQREFKLLEYLMKNEGRSVTRTMILEDVWGYHFDPQTNVIDVHISRIRSKIDKNAEYIKTIKGSGYIFHHV